jgi:hypothetical protein
LSEKNAQLSSSCTKNEGQREKAAEIQRKPGEDGESVEIEK